MRKNKGTAIMAILELVGQHKVRVSPVGVALFNIRWPCSKLDTGRAYSFEFDEGRNLIDTDVPEHSDGPESVALAGDCEAWHFDNVQPEWLAACGAWSID